MNQAFDIIKANRIQLASILTSHSLDQLNHIPDGLGNNIVWNIAHTIAVQESLTYGLSGLRWTAPKELVKGYARGTRPTEDVDQKFVEFLKGEVLDSLERLQENYNNGIFKEYKSFELSLGYTLQSVEDAIYFNIYHEALHMSRIIDIRKFIKLR